MSLEALWTMQYQDAHGWQTGGVIVLETGRVFGGDASFYYLGDYAVDGNRVTANIAVRHYDGDDTNAFGMPLRNFNVRGEVVRREGVMEGHFWRPEQPELRLPARLTRRSDLP